ncbi:MAG: HEAT repeat domain-containing protein, partial [Tepidisphaeraceae bacterium]
FASAMSAGDLRLAEAKPRLLKMLDDASPHVRIGVRYALHKLGDTRFTRDLEKTAVDADPRVRANTVLALGRLGEPTALRILRQMSHDKDAVVRIQVAAARWRLGDEDALRSLVAFTLSGYADDQIIALLGLAGPRDRRSIQHIRQALVSEYPEVALVAARAMGMLPPNLREGRYSDEGYGVAMKYIHSDDARQRSLAALALGEIGRPDAQPVLAELLRDPDADTRVAAATAILELDARP